MEISIYGKVIKTVIFCTTSTGIQKYFVTDVEVKDKAEAEDIVGKCKCHDKLYVEKFEPTTTAKSITYIPTSLIVISSDNKEEAYKICKDLEESGFTDRSDYEDIIKKARDWHTFKIYMKNVFRVPYGCIRVFEIHSSFDDAATFISGGEENDEKNKGEN